MAVALVQEDREDIRLSHQYRLSLKSAPSQSSFRVLAVLFYEVLEEEKEKEEQTSSMPVPFVWTPMSCTTSEGNEQQQQRTYIVGTNDEPGYMGGAICAERAAMVQLRFAPPHRITKLVIATDSIDPIAPGMLCREFLAGHGGRIPQLQQLSWHLPVISTGSMCRRCQKRDQELFVSSSSSASCLDGHSHHDIAVLQTTLRDLYPYPSPYTRLSAEDSVFLGKSYLHHHQEQKNQGEDIIKDNSIIQRLLEMAIKEARQQQSSESEVHDEIHPIYFGAAVAFRDGQIATSHQWSALEYGCSLDAVSQLASQMQLISKNSNGGSPNDNPPQWLVQVDQFGIAHAPFAPARAFLTEHGYSTCEVILHDTHNADNPTIDSVADWKLIHVPALSLAPHAPSWCAGTTTQSSTRSRN